MKELAKEEWREVVGYEGYYRVSNLGRIESLPVIGLNSSGYRYTRSGKIFNCRPSRSTGYVKVPLSKEGVKKGRLVHRLVAEAFIPNPDRKPEVNHRDGNRSNNALSNLEWATRSENAAHAYLMGLNKAQGENHHLTTLTGEQVLEIVKMLDNSKVLYKNIASIYGVDRKVIQDINVGRSWNWLTKRRGVVLPRKMVNDTHPRAKSVINCRGEKFGTVREATRFYKLKSHRSIGQACNGSQNTAGKYLDGTPIKWYYTEEFILKDGAIDGSV